MKYAVVPLALALALATGAVGWLLGRSNAPTRTVTVSEEESPVRSMAWEERAAKGDPVAGKSVFMGAACPSCHTLAEAGASGIIGPNLDQLKLTRSQIFEWVHNGRGTGMMPTFRTLLSEKDIADIAAFLAEAMASPGAPAQSSSDAGADEAPAEDTGSGATGAVGDAAPGKSVFVDSCGGCHTLAAAGATGAVGPNLDQSKLSASQMRQVIEAGRGGMPAWKGKLSDKQIADVVDFISGGGASGGGGAAPAPAKGAAGASGGAGDASAGKSVFLDSSCGGCHTLAAAGATGAVGPNLDQSKLSAAEMRAVIEAGKGGMPAWKGKLTDKQIADVVALLSGGGQSGGGAAEAPATGAASSASGGAGDAAAGKSVFAESSCGGCHTLAAAGATGAVGPNLDQTKLSASQMREIIEKGKGGMPPWKGRLSDKQIADVVSFLTSG